MFYALRLIVGILIITPIFYIKKRISGKANLGVYIIAAMIIISLLGFIPFENMFYTFDSPEDAYIYASSNAYELKHVIQGTDSALVIGKSDDGEYRIIVSKSKNGWKLGTGLAAFPVRSNVFNGCSVEVYHRLGCSDYYIEVYNLLDIDFAVTDSLNSEFKELEAHYSSTDGTEGTYTQYFTVLPSKDKNYALYIDSSEYYVFQESVLKDLFNDITQKSPTP